MHESALQFQKWMRPVCRSVILSILDTNKMRPKQCDYLVSNLNLGLSHWSLETSVVATLAPKKVQMKHLLY